MESASPHIPVLYQACMEHLDIEPDDIVLDGTLGFGGHSQGILDQLGPQGRLIGLDQDPYAIQFCQSRFSNYPQTHLVQLNFSQFSKALANENVRFINKGLLDLGMSSYHLDSSERGFSFLKSEPLDMRMNPKNPLSATMILSDYSEESLTQMFQTYGDLYRCQKLVSNIIYFRKQHALETTDDLIQIIKKSFFFKNRRSLYMKTCSQVFQALRIEVNQEFDHLSSFLNQVLDFLAPKGRIAIISFHSSEDRLVKHFIKGHKSLIKPCYKGVLTASQTEIKQNSRSKSAKLRVFEKCD